jgi:hypothetical protein
LGRGSKSFRGHWKQQVFFCYFGTSAPSEHVATSAILYDTRLGD